MRMTLNYDATSNSAVETWVAALKYSQTGTKDSQQWRPRKPEGITATIIQMIENSYIMSGDRLLGAGQWVKKMNHLYVHVCSFSASTLTPLFGWLKWHPACKRNLYCLYPEVPFLNTWMEKTEGNHKPRFCKVTVKMEVVMPVCVCVCEYETT